jgi:hypothetical protein
MPERAFRTEMWTEDEWFQSLSINQRYLFLYLKYNGHCKPPGIYRITLSTISFETNLDRDALPEFLESLRPKVEWYAEDNTVWVKDFLKEQAKSPKFITAAVTSLSNSDFPEDLVAEFELYNQSLLSSDVRPNLSLTKRECVIIRDNFRCLYCNREITDSSDYEVDHIIPRTRGGKDSYQNLAASCFGCSHKKLDKTPAEAGLSAPRPGTFHAAQAVYMLKTDEARRNKWLNLFPRKAEAVEAILNNIDRHYSTLNQVKPTYSSDTDPHPLTDTNTDSFSDKEGIFSLFGSFSLLRTRLQQAAAGSADIPAERERLKQELARIGREQGLSTQYGLQPDSGGADLCWINSQGRMVAAFEIDDGDRGVESLAKLGALDCPFRCLILRNGENLHHVERGVHVMELDLGEKSPEETIPRSESENGESLYEGDREVISAWFSVKGFRMAPSDASELVARLRTEFPDVDILAESKKWAARKLSEPLTRKTRPSAQIWNFMYNARKFAQERRERENRGKRFAGARPASDFSGGKW